MKLLAIALALWSSCAHADLYRWLDRQSGSVKYSSTPPPWYGDARKERTSPAVEVIRYNEPGAAAKPTPREAKAKVTFAALPPSTDYARAGEGIRPQVEAYEALSRELDRLDPAGAERRRAQRPPALDLLR